MKQPEQEVCHECEGSGKVVIYPAYIRKEYNCPTCHGTGLKPDPKLREKVAEELPRIWCGECPYKETMHLCKKGEHCRWQLDYADKIIALIKGEKDG